MAQTYESSERSTPLAHPYYPSIGSPLSVYKGQALDPLPTRVSADGKSLDNGPVTHASSSYADNTPPIRSSTVGNAFDFHIYYDIEDESQHAWARELHERVRREFPELRVYRFWDRPVGPHTLPMFEVNTFTPAQTGALFTFLTVWRGSLSVLVHPNTQDAYKDHTGTLGMNKGDNDDSDILESSV